MKIGFVGFGEAASHIATGLRTEGVSGFWAYDINTHTSGSGELIRRRAAETGTTLVESNADLTAACDLILCAVTANQALAAATQTAPGLTAGHLYADINSVSPALKQNLAGLIAATGARFVEVAVMAPVPPYNHKVPMLVGGPGATAFSERMTPLGMVMEVTGERVGEAAATKMCRSIVIKGMEALLTECVLSACRYGAAERVFASLGETFPSMDWAAMATYMTGRVVVHGERRAREMEEVAETVRSSGVEPIMANATVQRMDWSVDLALKQRFGGKAPASYEEFFRVVSEAVALK